MMARPDVGKFETQVSADQIPEIIESNMAEAEDELLNYGIDPSLESKSIPPDVSVPVNLGDMDPNNLVTILGNLDAKIAYLQELHAKLKAEEEYLEIQAKKLHSAIYAVAKGTDKEREAAASLSKSVVLADMRRAKRSYQANMVAAYLNSAKKSWETVSRAVSTRSSDDNRMRRSNNATYPPRTPLRNTRPGR